MDTEPRGLLLAFIDTRPEPGFDDQLRSIEQLKAFCAEASPADLPLAIEVRDALARVFLGPREGAADALGVLARRLGVRPDFGAEGGLGWGLDDAGDLAELFTPLMGAAIELWSGGGLDRLHICASARCIAPFVDDSRRGDRRFCSPRCATRERVQRHRAALGGS